METIYKINGGGQKVQQCVQNGMAVEYTVENSDWPETSQTVGNDSFTNYMWSTSLETLQEWANTWAGREVELVEAND